MERLNKQEVDRIYSLLWLHHWNWKNEPLDNWNKIQDAMRTQHPDIFNKAISGKNIPDNINYELLLSILKQHLF